MQTDSNGVPTVEYALSKPYEALIMCREAEKHEDIRERNRDLAVAAAAYAIAYAFDHDHTAWRLAVKKINKSELIKPKIRRDKHSDKIREKILLVIFRSQTNFDYSKSYKLARALHYCRMQLIKPEKLLDFINEFGGIKKLYTADTAEYPRQSRKKSTNTDLADGDKRVASYLDDLFIEEGPMGNGEKEVLLSQLEAAVERLKQFDGRDRAVIEIDSKEMGSLLMLTEEQEHTFAVRRGPSDCDAWVSLVGQRIR